jgi:hypothetical protein
MEYLCVDFRETRRVLLDGTEAGDTNKTLKVQRASYTVTLSGEPDYLPASQDVTVAGTEEDDPMHIQFT